MHGLFFLHGVACNASVKISKTDSSRVQNVCSSVPFKDDVCDSCPGSLALYCAGAASCQLQGFVFKVILLMPHLAVVTFMSTNLQVPSLFQSFNSSALVQAVSLTIAHGQVLRTASCTHFTHPLPDGFPSTVSAHQLGRFPD